jgi:hypothetical protein
MSTPEERWDQRTADLLRAWADVYDAAAGAHAKMSQVCVVGHVLLAAPAVVLPMVFPRFLPDEDVGAGFLACSVLAGRSQLLQPGGARPAPPHQPPRLRRAPVRPRDGADAPRRRAPARAARRR